MSGSDLPQSLRKCKSSSLTFLLSETCFCRRKAIIASLLDSYGKHSVLTYGGGTWYPQACKFLKAAHHTHSPFEKSVIKRTMQYLKDRTEGFDDYFPCKKKKCKLRHVVNWLHLFAGYHNRELNILK